MAPLEGAILSRGDCCDASVITTMIVIVIAAVFLVLVTANMFILMTVFIPVITVLCTITRHIFILIPFVLDKEDPPTAGVVLAAMPVPMFNMARWDVQVDRLAVHRSVLDDHRPRIDHNWPWDIADIYLAIEAGLPDADRDSNISSDCGGGGGSYCYRNQYTFHVCYPRVKALFGKMLLKEPHLYALM